MDKRHLIMLQQIPADLNMLDHFTKQVGSTLFAQHNDYTMGRVPPRYSLCYPGFRDWHLAQP